jgi:hypothetical protein
VNTNRSVILPPFSWQSFTVSPQRIADLGLLNPHPTDILLDTSVFSPDRISLVREFLIGSSPILLKPVLVELADLKTKANLVGLADLVFPGGSLNSRFRGDDLGALSTYIRVATRYASLLRWRRDAIDIPTRQAKQKTGIAPIGKERTRLIRELLKGGIADSTIKLANKGYRANRYADEVLAVFAALSPIVTGRDCFLYTADEDVVEQTWTLCNLLFEDYGAYLMANDFRSNESHYQHRHPHFSDLFVGEATAIGRTPNPDYLLPPPMLIKTCSTTVVDVGRLKGFTWISARNMEPAIAFQERDPLGRKGDPGMGNSIIFTLSEDIENGYQCKAEQHFGIGTPSYLKVVGDHAGPMASFELARVLGGRVPVRVRRSRLVSPFSAYTQRLLARACSKPPYR